jgi:tetratricopeptide (TPR) repeat protein
MIRRMLWAGLLGLGVMAPGVAEAQLARRAPTDRVLVLSPLPGAGVDTAYAMAMGDALRERMETRYRMRFIVVRSVTICEALEASGFTCAAPLPVENAPALARFLQTTGYAVSWLEKGPDSLRLRLRLVDAAGSGLSGWDRFAAPAATPAADFGRTVADGLEPQLRAAEYTRDCTERRQRSDPKGAAERAGRAFAIFPNHPAAAMCLALTYELEEQPIDSIVGALRRAVTGDSLNADAWEELGRRLQEKGDTAGALGAFTSQLRAEPTNMRLRLGISAALTAQRQFADAVVLLDEGLAMNPGDMPTLQLKERACLDGELWRCGLDALEQEFELDTALASDSIFYQKTFGAAQSIPDTAAMVLWSGRAIEQFPTSVALWRARAAALKTSGQRPEAVAAYQRIVDLDSTQIGSALAAGQYLLDTSLVIDTAVPLDTARLLLAERMLLLAGSQVTDTATSMAIATLFYNPAAKIAQLRMMPHLPLASRFLEHALAFDKRGALRGPANFFLGLSLFFQVTELDGRVRQEKSCALVDVEIEMTRRAKQAFQLGRQISPQTTDQLMGYVNQIESALPTYKPAFKCPA